MAERKFIDPEDIDFIQRVKNNPRNDDQQEKHYMMTDQHSGQKLDHLKMIQIELPRYNVEKLPKVGETSTDKDWWIRLLRYSEDYTDSDMSDKRLKVPFFVNEALDRLTFSKWSPRLFEEYKDSLADRGKYSTVMQIEREEGRAEGRAEGQAEGKAEGKVEVAKALMAKRMDDDFIIETTGLRRDQVEALRKGAV